MWEKFWHKILGGIATSFFKIVAKLGQPQSSLKFLLNLDNKLYEAESQAAVRYGNGQHPKHRLINYHQFFIENIEEGQRVLDVGCGKGFVVKSIAGNFNNVKITGIDKNEDCIIFAKQNVEADHISFIYGDVLKELPDTEFDIIILSNILEHLPERVLFLKKIIEKYRPKKLLIRVPCFERDWRVPLKKELGVEYRLDRTHHIEHKKADLFNELERSGLSILKEEIRWGEIWCVASSKIN